MIEVKKIESKYLYLDSHKHPHRIVLADLIADNSMEVEEIGNRCDNIVGLSESDTLAFGSTCFTATMEFGMLDSVGNWHFQ